MYVKVRHEALSKCYIIRTLNCTYFRVLATFCVKEARDGTIQVGRGPVNVKKFRFIPKTMESYRGKQAGDGQDLCFKKLTLVVV